MCTIAAESLRTAAGEMGEKTVTLCTRVVDVSQRSAVDVAISSLADEILHKGLRYRFNNEDDLANLFHSLRRVLTEHSSLRALFLKGYDDSSSNILEALKKFISGLAGDDRRRFPGFLLPGSLRRKYVQANEPFFEMDDTEG